MQSEADAEVGHAVGPCIIGGKDLPFDTTVPEPARHEDAVCGAQPPPGVRMDVIGHPVLEFAGLQPIDGQLAVGGHGGVLQRFDDRQISVREVGVLAHHGDGDVLFERIQMVGHPAPVVQEAVGLYLQAKGGAEPLCFEHQGNVVDVRDVMGRNDGLLGHVAEGGQFRPCFGVQRRGRSAHENVGRDAEPPEFLHRVLGGLGLLFTHRSHHWNEGDVHEGHVVSADAELELPQGLDVRGRFNVADRAAQFDDAHLRLKTGVVAALMRDGLDPIHDGVCDVRDDLNGFSEVIATSFGFDDLRVHFPRGQVVVPSEVQVEKAFVIPEIEVDFAAVVKDEHFPMLERTHRSCVRVQIGVDFDGGDP